MKTRLSPSNDTISHLWYPVSHEFRAWERVPEAPKYLKDMLPAEFSRK